MTPVAIKPFTAYYGLAIYEFQHGIIDHCIAAWDLQGQPSARYRHKIYISSDGRSYIVKGGERHYLDEFIKVI